MAVSVPLYTYAGYPLLLLALGRVMHRDVKKQAIHPFVSLLVPAYNEAQVIGRKIANSLALDYPPDRLEIVIASDGSTDQTVAVAERFAAPGRVRVLVFRENRGKIARFTFDQHGHPPRYLLRALRLPPLSNLGDLECALQKTVPCQAGD